MWTTRDNGSFILQLSYTPIGHVIFPDSSIIINTV